MQDYEVNFPSPELKIHMTTGSNSVAESFGRALEQDKAGEKEKAFQTVNAALAEEPRNPYLYFLAARYLFDMNNLTLAKEAIDKALILNKKEPNFLKLQGDILVRSGLFDQAATSYKKCLRIDKVNIGALNNLGNLSRLLGENKEATKYLKRAINNDDHYVPAHYNLALVSIDRDELEDAEQRLLFCIDEAPYVAEPWLKLDQIEPQIEHTSANLKKLQETIALNPRDTRLRFQLIKHYESTGDDEAANSEYKAIADIDPGLVSKLITNSVVMMNRLEQPQAQQFADTAIKLDPRYNIFQNYLFMSSYLCVLSDEDSFQNHVKWSDTQCRTARNRQFSHTPDAHKKPKLRVGYVSPDMYEHAVSFFLRGILENHGTNKVEVFSYAQVHKRDGTTEELQGLSSNWREIQHLDDYEAAKLIHEDGIDVLVDLSGHTRESRINVFAYKPAPIQVTYMGYPGSTGLAEMDYWISDHFIHPSNTPEPSTEKKYRLDRCWMSYTNRLAPEIGAKPLGNPPTFGVINHIGKHSPEFIDTWAEILKQRPNARLIVKSIEFSSGDLRIKVLDLLEARGLDRARVTLLGISQSYDEHMRTYNQIDVCLDPFPYTGGTSTADALMMGTPIVTLPRDSLKSRMCGSLLTAIGRTEWIADSQEDYAKRAIKIAEQGVDLELKQDIRQSLLNSPATDSKDLTQHLEAAYHDMLSTYVNEL